MSGRIAEGTLPSGIHVAFREPRGADELAAMDAAVNEPVQRRAMVSTWAQMLACCESVTHPVSGSLLDRTRLTPDGFRNLFGAAEFLLVEDIWGQFWSSTQEEIAAFKASIKISVKS